MGRFADSGRRVADGLVAPSAFGLIEGIIGAADKLIDRVRDAEISDPGRQRRRHARARQGIGGSGAQPLAQPQRSGGIRIGRDHRKLIATEPCQRIPSARLLAEGVRDQPQRAIPDRMTVRIVERLERVEVKQHQRQRARVSSGPLALRTQPAVEGPVVQQSSQPIGHRLTAQLLDLGTQRRILGVQIPLTHTAPNLSNRDQ